MRIRSIRPEFWSSEDIASLPWEYRLVYIGLWSYVDDNGVGRDVPKLIAADLFPLDDDPGAVLAQIAGALTEYSNRGMIHRYKVDGKPYLHISSWGHDPRGNPHQQINRPSKGRYPLPTRGDASITELTETLTEDSLSTQANNPVGEGEKGRRGEGEKGTSATRELTLAEPDLNTGTLIAEWIEHCPRRPPTSVVGQISKQVKQLLETDQIAYPVVRQALADWQSKGVHPAVLPSIVHDIQSAGARPRANRKQQETDDIFQRAAERNGLLTREVPA